jgi:hypothetical protein
MNEDAWAIWQFEECMRRLDWVRRLAMETMRPRIRRIRPDDTFAIGRWICFSWRDLDQNSGTRLIVGGGRTPAEAYNAWKMERPAK